MSEQEPSPHLDELESRTFAAKRGDRSDPKIEAMVEMLIAQLTDPSRNGEENANAMEALAARLAREYKS